jgi:hypothetical protein
MNEQKLSVINRETALRELLGIRNEPTLYELVGCAKFEHDHTVIENGADRVLGFLKQHQTGKFEPVIQGLMNEVANAKLFLLNDFKRNGYNAGLKQPAPSFPVLEQPVDNRPPIAYLDRGTQRLIIGGFLALMAVPMFFLFYMLLSSAGRKPKPVEPVASVVPVEKPVFEDRGGEVTPEAPPVREVEPVVPLVVPSPLVAEVKEEPKEEPPVVKEEPVVEPVKEEPVVPVVPPVVAEVKPEIDVDKIVADFKAKWDQSLRKAQGDKGKADFLLSVSKAANKVHKDARPGCLIILRDYSSKLKDFNRFDIAVKTLDGYDVDSSLAESDFYYKNFRFVKPDERVIFSGLVLDLIDGKLLPRGHISEAERLAKLVSSTISRSGDQDLMVRGVTIGNKVKDSVKLFVPYKKAAAKSFADRSSEDHTIIGQYELAAGNFKAAMESFEKCDDENLKGAAALESNLLDKGQLSYSGYVDIINAWVAVKDDVVLSHANRRVRELCDIVESTASGDSLAEFNKYRIELGTRLIPDEMRAKLYHGKGGKSYFFVERYMTQAAAKDLAAKHGGSILTLDNDIQAADVYAYFRQLGAHRSTWTDATLDGFWRWESTGQRILLKSVPLPKDNKLDGMVVTWFRVTKQFILRNRNTKGGDDDTGGCLMIEWVTD